MYKQFVFKKHSLMQVFGYIITILLNIITYIIIQTKFCSDLRTLYQWSYRNKLRIKTIGKSKICKITRRFQKVTLLKVLTTFEFSQDGDLNRQK